MKPSNEKLIKSRKTIDKNIKFLLTYPKTVKVLQTIPKEFEIFAKNFACSLNESNDDILKEQKINKVLYSMSFNTSLQFLKIFTVNTIWYAITHIFKKD